jgi:hypothetical protein
MNKVSVPFSNQQNASPTEIELEGDTMYDIEELIKRAEKIRYTM